MVGECSKYTKGIIKSKDSLVSTCVGQRQDLLLHTTKKTGRGYFLFIPGHGCELCILILNPLTLA